MSESEPSSETRIPLSIVMMTVGLIIVATIVAIWIAVPSRMPRAVYRVVEPYLPQVQSVPTRIIQATNPEAEHAQAQGARSAVSIPLSSAETYTTYPDYFVSAEEALTIDPHAGKPVRILIPKIEVDAPISEVLLERIGAGEEAYYQWQVPERYEAGWHNTSARLSRPGNTVINGHHNIHGEIFRDLDELELGDEITVYDDKGAHTYVVTEKEILAERGQPLSVRIENTRWIEPTSDERVTLVTCWPYTGNSHRLIIVAKPTDS